MFPKLTRTIVCVYTYFYVFLRIFMEENAMENGGEVCSSIAKNIFGKPVMFPPVFREREASSLFRRGQRQSTPSFTAKSYFRWKFIALARIEASFPAERNKESVSTATRAKDNWHAILSCPFSPAGRSLLAMANPVDFFPEELYGCASWRLLNVPTPRLIYSPGLSKERNLDIYRPFPALR